MSGNWYSPPTHQRPAQPRQGSLRHQPSDHEIRWFTPRRPYILQPKKRHNYRNVLPKCLLTPLGTATAFRHAAQAASRPKYPRTWALPPPIINATTTPKSSISLLSADPREEKASAPKALSVDAKPFQPRPSLNVHAPSYDPFGNIVQIQSPPSAHELRKWEEVLINDGLIDSNTPRNESKGLTVDTSVGSPIDADPPKYTPTTPPPCFYSLFNQWEPYSYVSPTYSDYGYTYEAYECFHDEVYEYFQPANSPFEFAQSTTPSDESHYFFPTYEEDIVSVNESAKTTPASPSVTQPVGSDPNTTRLNDTGSVSRGNKNIAKVVNCNANGWNSSINVESTIRSKAKTTTTIFFYLLHTKSGRKNLSMVMYDDKSNLI